MDTLPSICNKVKAYLAFFERWYTSAKRRKKDQNDSSWVKSFIAPLTYGNVKVGVWGFLRFCEMVLELDEIEYVPMLWSTSSTIESDFSQIRARNGDSAASFEKDITSINTSKLLKGKIKNDMYIQK